MSIDAMKQALEALEELHRTGDTQVFDLCFAPKVIPALRLAIEQAEKQEPVAWVGLEKDDMPDGEDPMYDHDFFIKGMVWADITLRKKNAAPPQRQPLTWDQVNDELWLKACNDHTKLPTHVVFARLIERAHGIGGEA